MEKEQIDKAQQEVEELLELSATSEEPSIEDQARADMEEMDEIMTQLTHNMTLIDWEYNTNITEENSEASAEYAAMWSAEYKSKWEDVIKKYEDDYQDFKDADL